MADEDDIPLPPYWRRKESRSRPGEIYYVNVKLRTTTWIHPGLAKKKAEEKKEEEQKKERTKRERSKDDDPQPSFTSAKWSPAAKTTKKQKVEGSDEETDKATPAEPTRLVLKTKKKMLSGPATLFTKDRQAKEKYMPATLADKSSEVSKEKSAETHTNRSSETHKSEIPDAVSIFAPEETPALEEPTEEESAKKEEKNNKKKKKKEDAKLIPRPVAVEESVRKLNKFEREERRRIRKALQKSLDEERKDKEKKNEVKSPAKVAKGKSPVKLGKVESPVKVAKVIKAKPNLVKEVSTQDKVTNINNNNKYSAPTSKPAATSTPQTTRKPSEVPPPQKPPVPASPELPVQKPETKESQKSAIKKPTVGASGSGAPLKFRKLSVPQRVASRSVDGTKPVASRSVDSTKPVTSSSVDGTKPVASSSIVDPELVASSSMDVVVPMVAEDVLAATSISSTAQSAETDMEVDIDVGVFHDLLSVRQNATANQVHGPTDLMDITPQPMFERSSYTSKLYIVVDTNILMHDLNLIDAIKDMRFPGMGRPTLVIPWVVMQELDWLKDGKTGTSAALRTQVLARHPVNYLNKVLQSGHPRVVGQTPAQDQQKDTLNGLQVECNDDRVLHCCLQWKAKHPTAEVLLLTLDKNLRTKAIISDIKPCSIKDLTALLEQGPDQANAVIQTKDDPTQKLLDEIMCELKNLLQVALSVVMETEMRLIYEELWCDIVYRKPPWTLYGLLECFNKHWIAVFGSIMKRQNKKYLDQLLTHFKPGTVDRLTMEQVKDIVADCGNFVQPLRQHSTYSGQLDEANAKLELLYKISRDVANGKHSVAPLNQLTSLYETGIKFTAEPEFTEEMRNNVQNAFQLAWENILFCGTWLNENLFSSDGTRRAEYLFFFAHLILALTTVNVAYIDMLKVHPDDVHQQPQPFVDVSDALDTLAEKACIQPWTKLEPTSLQTYYGMPGNREVLENGFQQLQNFLTGFNECWTKLSPDEQVQLQICQQQETYNSQ